MLKPSGLILGSGFVLRVFESPFKLGDRYFLEGLPEPKPDSPARIQASTAANCAFVTSATEERKACLSGQSVGSEIFHKLDFYDETETCPTYPSPLPGSANSNVSDDIALVVIADFPDVIDVVDGECLLLDGFLRRELFELFRRR